VVCASSDEEYIKGKQTNHMKVRSDEKMDFRKRYVKEQVQKSTKGNFWVNFGKRSSPEVQKMLRFVGTQSNKEFAQIVKGLLNDLANGNLKIVEVKKNK